MVQIYLLNDDKVVTLKEKPIRPEEKLQSLIEENPHLIPSPEIVSSPSFVVLKREAGVSSGSIDLLLIDQYMVPTILETKVANPEARRKIVAQGLDYAASLTTQITGEVIGNWAKEYWGEKFNSVLSETLGVDKLDTELIDQNLDKTRIRLIFAADIIPHELKRLVEFLNKSSREMEAYALEIRLFPIKGGEIVTVNIFGPTIREETEKLTTRRLTDKEGIITKAKEKNQKLSEKLQQLIETGETYGFLLTWGTKSVSLRIGIQNGPKFKILEAYQDGSLLVDFLDIKLRTAAVNNVYEKLDKLINLKEAFRSPERKFGLGRKRLDELTEEEFKEFLSLLRKVGNL